MFKCKHPTDSNTLSYNAVHLSVYLPCFCWGGLQGDVVSKVTYCVPHPNPLSPICAENVLWPILLISVHVCPRWDLHTHSHTLTKVGTGFILFSQHFTSQTLACFLSVEGTDVLALITFLPVCIVLAQPGPIFLLFSLYDIYGNSSLLLHP